MDRKYLRQRRRTWYVRVRVPPSLQNKIGKQEIVRSLKTQDIDEARQKRWAAVAEIKGYLDAMFGKGRLCSELYQARIYRGLVAMDQMTENIALQSWAFHNRSSFIGDELPDLDIVRLGQAIIKGEAQETATPITERLDMHLKELAGHARKQTV